MKTVWWFYSMVMVHFGNIIWDGCACYAYTLTVELKQLLHGKIGFKEFEGTTTVLNQWISIVFLSLSPNFASDFQYFY